MKNKFSLDMKVDGRDARLSLISTNKDHFKVQVDDTEYDVDLTMVERGVYSILHKGKSYNIELIEGDNPRKYIVNTYKGTYDLELIDAETRYQQSRNNSVSGDGDGTVSSPMPGKVVKIPVSVGDKVSKDDIVVIISAMKMESDYKAPLDGIIKEILVGEGDTVGSNQPLIIIE